MKFDKHLREISRDKRYWEEKRKKIRKAEKRLDGLLEEYESRMSLMDKEKKKVVKETKVQAEQLLGQINQKIENTVQKIREEQADKEKTRELRKQAEEFKSEIKGQLSKNEQSDDDKLLAIKKEHHRLRKNMRGIEPKPVEGDIIPEQVGLYPGTKIRMIEKDLYGEILELKSNSILVAFGQMITTVKADQIEVISEKQYTSKVGTGSSSTSSFGVDMQHRRLTFSNRLDLRGVRGEEAMHKLQAFIDEAIMLGVNDLRVLHGKGNGILRQMTRDFLSTVDIVAQFKDEDIRLGGSGVTIVKLDF